MHKCQKSLNELFNEALKYMSLFCRLSEYKDMGCQVCKVLSWNIFGRGQLQKSPRKSSRWDLFPEPDCVTSIRWAQLRIACSLRKKRMARESPKCSKKIWLLSFEPGPNPSWTRTLSILPGPSPALGPCRAEARGSGSGPCRPLASELCFVSNSYRMGYNWTLRFIGKLF
jgi:hypothetical protein